MKNILKLITLILLVFFIATLKHEPPKMAEIKQIDSIAELKESEPIQTPQIEETINTEPVEQKNEPEVVTAEAVIEQPAVPVSGSCYDELIKYEWVHSVAYEVMMAESSGIPDRVSDDSDDYSVGCFQINLLGDSNMNAKYRDAVANGYTGSYDRVELRSWLEVPANNVAVAVTMWRMSGWVPWSATTCKYKVVCY